MQHDNPGSDGPGSNACARLENALSALDPHARSLMQRFLAGQSAAEIAAALEAPEGAVADKIRELVHQLRASLGR